MPYGLYISAEGAMAQNRRLEVISNNLANVTTVGFKRDLAIFRARYAEQIDAGLAEPGSGCLDDLGGGVELEGTVTDFSLGPLKQTKAPLDLALDSGSFFVIRRGRENLLTRAGNFLIDAATNEVTTQDGDRVLDDIGQPIVINPETSWSFTAEGCLQQDGGLVPMAIVRPRQPGDLVKVGENMFRPLAPPVSVEPHERRVEVGFLEYSSVKPATELINMIETSRAFEANVSLIRSQDSMLGTLISRVLHTS